MTRLLYWMVGIIARAHTLLMSLNDSFEYGFSDKELHFLVMGLLGMLLILVIYPLFKCLARAHHEMVIAWIYVFTLLVVFSFAIEIGQKLTGTGTMEFADIAFGLAGFIAMFIVFAALRGLYHLVAGGIQRRRMQ